MLSTERMKLRPLAGGDVDDLVALDSDPEVMRHILVSGQPAPTREDYCRPGGLLSRMLAFEDEPFGYFAAEQKGAFLGWFHLRPSVFEPAILELGYRLRRSFWGQGLATEGGYALCRYAFYELDMPLVDACAVPANTASIGVMKKLGMKYLSSQMHPREPNVKVARYGVDSSTFSEVPFPI